MPVAISFSERDLKRGATVEPAWYLLKIDSVSEKPSKDGNSTNYPVEATIIKNADNGDAKFAEVPVEWNFNSKAPGFALGFVKTLNPDLEIKAGARYDLQAAEGKQIEAFIANKIFEGRTLNDVTSQYRAAGTGEKLQAAKAAAPTA